MTITLQGLHWNSQSTPRRLAHISSIYVFRHQPMMAGPNYHTSDEMVCSSVQAAVSLMMGVQQGGGKAWAGFFFSLKAAKKAMFT